MDGLGAGGVGRPVRHPDDGGTECNTQLRQVQHSARSGEVRCPGGQRLRDGRHVAACGDGDSGAAPDYGGTASSELAQVKVDAEVLRRDPVPITLPALSVAFRDWQGRHLVKLRISRVRLGYQRLLPPEDRRVGDDQFTGCAGVPRSDSCCAARSRPSYGSAWSSERPVYSTFSRGPPVVRGVGLADSTRIGADLVVDASGRRGDDLALGQDLEKFRSDEGPADEKLGPARVARQSCNSRRNADNTTASNSDAMYGKLSSTAFCRSW